MNPPISTANGSDSASSPARTQHIWGSFLGGVIVGFVALLAVVAQPMFQQLQSLKKDVMILHRDLNHLVGASGEAGRAGNLLADLARLQDRGIEAQGAIDELRRRQDELLTEGRRSTEASAALTNFVALQTSLLKQRDLTPVAAESLEEITRIQQQVCDQKPTLAQSNEALSGLLALNAKLAEQSETTATAREKTQELLAMKQEILDQSTDFDAARTQANRMILMQQELVSHGADGPEAFKGLDQLVAIKDRVLEQTPALADAVQNIEMLADFRQELDGQIKSLDGMRQTLLQLALLEPTINRVASTITPLAELANIRRLSENDLRSAARSIIDSRVPRVSSNPLPRDTHSVRSSRDALQMDDELFRFPVDSPASPATEPAPVPEPLPLPTR
ncbi:MAG: hypothetical protein NT069_02105 [Planctomycetota bacterium]|nr:hypothetical protein [Planctomycetota bacterium]